MKLTPIAVLIAITWSGLIIWSVRKCWRRPLDTINLKYYLRGKTMGIVMTVSLAFIFPEIYRFPGIPYWLEVVYVAFIGFPIATVGGYLYGKFVQAINQPPLK
jgi:hypothetical protein